MLYQLHRALQFLHDRGIACGGFAPRDVLLTDTLWVRLGTLPFSDAVARSTSPLGPVEASPSSSPTMTLPSALAVPRTVASYASRSITEQWCDGDVSNLEYLLLLNAAAGRRMVRTSSERVLKAATKTHGLTGDALWSVGR